MFRNVETVLLEFIKGILVYTIVGYKVLYLCTVCFVSVEEYSDRKKGFKVILILFCMYVMYMVCSSENIAITSYCLNIMYLSL